MQVRIRDFLAGASYHFRIEATNTGGITYGAEESFTTHAASPGQRPLLRLRAARTSVPAGQRVCVRFTATAGSKHVSGASASTTSKRTTASGRARICTVLAHPGLYTATVSASGMKSAAARVRVRPWQRPVSPPESIRDLGHESQIALCDLGPVRRVRLESRHRKVLHRDSSTRGLRGD